MTETTVVCACGRVRGDARKSKIQRMGITFPRSNKNQNSLTYGLMVHGERDDNLFWLMFGGMIRKL
jgi:hypothetical protein